MIIRRTGCCISFERLCFLEHPNRPNFNTTVPHNIATEFCVNSTCIVNFGRLTKEFSVMLRKESQCATALVTKLQKTGNAAVLWFLALIPSR